jgi:hypothetical protein
VPQRLRFDTEVPDSVDSMKKMENHSFLKSSVKISFLKKSEKKANNLFVVMLLILMFATGCATQHRYKKYKPIPCPCEKENKR